MSSEDYGLSSFPRSPRFFNHGTNLPDLKNYKHIKDNKIIYLNNQSVNVNYNPFNSAQLKTKAVFPIDFFHLQNRITLSHNNTDTKNDIPSFKLNPNEANDPIKFIESLSSEGKEHGAIKLIVPPSMDSMFRYTFQINPDLFWFQSNKLLNDPKSNELENRLKFHKELINFHMSKKNDDPEPTTSPKHSKLDSLMNPTTELDSTDNGTLPADKLSQNPTERSPNSKQKLPPFLTKLPMIDKRPLDLYKLFRSVQIRGGFAEVIHRKLWAQIGRELGYKGKIMTSLSSSLKSSYLRILLSFEMLLGDRKYELIGITMPETNGKRPYSESQGDEEDSSKKRKLNSEAPLVLGSSRDFKRSIKLKSSKGILLNSPHLVDLKQLNVFVSKDLSDLTGSPQNNQKQEQSRKKNTSKETVICPITSESQLNHSLKALFDNRAIHQDKSRLESNGKLGSIYNLRQFMEKDAKFQEFLLFAHRHFFSKQAKSTAVDNHSFPTSPVQPTTPTAGGVSSGQDENSTLERKAINLKEFEQLFWSVISNRSDAHLNGVKQPNDGLELENGVNLSSLVNGSGFVKIGDDLINFKNQLTNVHAGHTITMHSNQHSNSNSPTIIPAPSPSSNGMNYIFPRSEANTFNSSEITYYNSQDYISKITHASLNPWNLHNLPILPNSLLGALSETDINNQDLIHPVLNIGMTFSLQNWKCEDHFTQLCNYQFFGSCKRWYFIPELEFEKFETLVEEINNNNNDRVNLNYDDQNWNYESLLSLLDSPDEISNMEYEALMNSLENLVNPYPDYRLQHSNSTFQKLIDYRKRKTTTYNQEFMITPQLLDERGIKYTTTIQKPGEIIVKYPKTYSSTISFGLNLSEEVNFATKSWLSYAIDGEKWLKKQAILPNFLTFRLLCNIAQIYDSGNNNIHFNAEVFGEVSRLYNILYEKELELRKDIRDTNFHIKEVVIDERTLNEVDVVSDDNYSNTYPSKVLLTDVKLKQTFNLTLEDFLEYSQLNDQDESLPKLVNNPDIKIELHLFCSDEKLKGIQRTLASYHIDYHEWMSSYEQLMNEFSELPFKSYKTLLAEGEKIYSTISSSNYISLLDPSNRPALSPEQESEAIKTNTFKSYIENLRSFVHDANEFIEDCQSILSIKHLQRIRNGNNNSKNSNGIIQSKFIQNSAVEGDYSKLTKLLNLIDQFPKWNISCPEFEKMIEFKNEIENFDRACKTTLSKNVKNIDELDNLINLGSSFGIALPSLNFLIRVRNMIRWEETFSIIINGGDPFSDKKDLFTLSHLRVFYQEGIKNLGKDGLAKIKTIENLILRSEEFINSIQKFLDKQTFVNTIDTQELVTLITQIEEKAIKKSDERIFVELEVSDRLIHLSGNVGLIDQFNTFVNSPQHQRFTYHEIRQLKTSIDESGLKFDTTLLINNLFAAERWVFLAWEIFRHIKIITTFEKTLLEKRSDIDPRLTLNAELVDVLESIWAKLSVSFATDTDMFENSSSYAVYDEETPEQDLVEEKPPMIYCLCREYEYGTMIECDKCNEWYHNGCVNEPEVQNEDDTYSCPMCKLVDSLENSDNFVTKQVTSRQVLDLIDNVKGLKVRPVNEIDLLEDIGKKMSETHSEIIRIIDNISDSPDAIRIKIRKLKFLLRKVYGSPILCEDSLRSLLNVVRVLEQQVPPQAPEAPKVVPVMLEPFKTNIEPVIKADIEPVTIMTNIEAVTNKTKDPVDTTGIEIKIEPENSPTIVRDNQTPNSNPIAEANGGSSVVQAGPIVNSEADSTNASDPVPIPVVAQPEVVRSEPRLSMIQLLNEPESEELLIK